MAAFICWVSVPGRALARQMARELVQWRLAACVTIIGPVESHFFWEGKIERAKEVLLMIKTVRSRLGRLEQTLKARHPYAVPEIIATKIEQGYGPYLRWIDQSVKRS